MKHDLTMVQMLKGGVTPPGIGPPRPMSFNEYTQLVGLCFLETGLSGAELCAEGDSIAVTADNVGKPNWAVTSLSSVNTSFPEKYAAILAKVALCLNPAPKRNNIFKVLVFNVLNRFPTFLDDQKNLTIYFSYGKLQTNATILSSYWWIWGKTALAVFLAAAQLPFPWKVTGFVKEVLCCFFRTVWTLPERYKQLINVCTAIVV